MEKDEHHTDNVMVIWSVKQSVLVFGRRADTCGHTSTEPIEQREKETTQPVHIHLFLSTVEPFNRNRFIEEQCRYGPNCSL